MTAEKEERLKACNDFRRISRNTVITTGVTALLLAAVGISASSYAFIRLATGSTGLAWPSAGASPITFTINSSGCPDITDDSEEAAIRLAFQAWEDVPTSKIFFQEDTSAASRARTDFADNNLHTVFFDTDNSSNFFSGNSGLVAITPVDFFFSGQIFDADIIFNSRDHRFSTDGSPGTFDVQNIGTHEVGHFIGLDHTGIHGATMNPFAIIGEVRLRSLASDDVAGVSTVYPAAGFQPGSITGTIIRSDGAAVRGAHVVAENETGQPAATALADNSGRYTISGLPSGFYKVYAEPLDGPVRAQNISTRTSKAIIETNFGTTFLSGSPQAQASTFVSAGSTTSVSQMEARASVGLNVTGVNPPSGRVGTTLNVVLFGSSFNSADTIAVAGPGVSPISKFISSSGSSATIRISIDASAAPGLRNLVVSRASGDAVALTGGFEILAAAPAIETINPSSGVSGDTVSIFGQGFEAGAQVIIGSGIATNVQVTSDSELVATLPGGTEGPHDVTVINPDGQEARLGKAFTIKAGSAPSTPTSPSTPSTPQTSTPAQSQPSSSGRSGGGGGGGGGGCRLATTPGSTNPLSGGLMPLLLLAACLVLRRRS